MIKFGTKSETLANLEARLKHAMVLPQLCFTVREWQSEGGSLRALKERPDWLVDPVIVRSSGKAEDTEMQSLAGHYCSVANVLGEEELLSAIQKVVTSFGEANPEDQVFIQPMLNNVKISGVAFTRDPNNGGYYYVVNYDNKSGTTDTVTEGACNDLKTYYHVKNSKRPDADWLSDLFGLLDELEVIFSNDSLDVEFALSADNELVLFQVRPLLMPYDPGVNATEQQKLLSEIEVKLHTLSKPHPYLLGERSVFGVMPDWNPAEIIGIRPRPLALSLYKELVTDSIWAYQRDNYGYRNLRSFPLLVALEGLPYIDVRVSFNSFIPGELDDRLAERLVSHYIDRLIDNPSAHDKVEFEIIYSCYTLDLAQRLEELKDYGFDENDLQKITESLRELTNGIIHNQKGLWKGDVEKLEELKRRRDVIWESNLTRVEKIYWLMEDCKRYGTLPFAGLARAGFIAVQLLKSLVRVGVLKDRDYERFMGSLDTVSSCMARDYAQLSKESFLEKYGHLRPGTYDILSPRYDEAPDQYFDWETLKDKLEENNAEQFLLSLESMNLLEKLLIHEGIEHDVISFLNFIKGAIEGREYAKFVFTKSLSDILMLIRQIGEEHKISIDDASYLNIDVFRKLYASSGNIKENLNASIADGRNKYIRTRSISLPPLITDPGDVWNFELPENEPNYITVRCAKGRVANESDKYDMLTGSIMLIQRADPGYDWIFSKGIAGFITMFGGANSHMAIRAGELRMPAVIGAGETLFNQWSKADILEIDCANKQVRILR